MKDEAFVPVGYKQSPEHSEVFTKAQLLQYGADCVKAAQPAPVQEPVGYVDLVDGEYIGVITGEVGWEEKLYTAPPAAPVQEPVAIALNTGTKQGVKWLKNVEHGEKLYTTPPAQRTWVGLTDEEIDATPLRQLNGYAGFARAIEAKLKEKNT
jgi:hypothetical protein